MTSESTRFLGQPNETKPTVGAVGREELLTALLYPDAGFQGRNWPFSSDNSKKWVDLRELGLQEGSGDSLFGRFERNSCRG